MARIYPQLPPADLRRLPSRAEARLYEAFRDQLDDRYIVLYSVPFVRPGAGGAHRDGEADFVVFDERAGFVVIEVKGGGVSFDPVSGTWASTDRRGVRHKIKDPFRQATEQKHEVLRQLQSHRRWRALGAPRISMGHAVCFPDLDDVSVLASPQRPQEIIGGRAEIGDVGRWVDGVARYWGSASPLGPGGAEVVMDLFCRPVEVRPLLARELEEEERERVRLTEEQARMLRGLGLRRRAAIAGGAGTGKTLLAIQKARELADEGYRTLLLCYNRPLSDHLKRVVGAHPHLLAMTFHQLCDWRVRQVREALGRDLLAEAAQAYPGEDRFDVQMPYALALAAEELGDPFDAVVVDEGQDFGEEYWLPVELSMRDSEESLLYVLYDPNQSVYGRASTFPISEPPFLLTVNCRNTRPIHEAAYRFFDGDRTDPPGIEGKPVEHLCAPTLDAQARRLHAVLVRLLHDEDVPAGDITVLVADGTRKADYYGALVGRPLPAGSAFSVESYGGRGSVSVDTVHRFKGLEASVVFLWGLEGLDLPEHEPTMYVGLSRAKSRLYLVGTECACAAVGG